MSEWLCPKCGFNIKTSRKKHFNACDGTGPRRRKENKYGKKGIWNKGKTYEELFGKEKALEIKEKVRKAATGNKNWSNMPEEKKNEYRRKAKENIEKRYDKGWDPKPGRSKKYKYKNFLVDGTWELEFCKWADEVELNFERNQDRFNYILEGVNRKYKPDFKLSNNIYVEIKGYQTDKDLAKWKQFSQKLIVLKKSQIDKIKNRNFNKKDLLKYIWKE